MKWGRCGLVWQEVTKQERLMNNFTIVWNFCDCSDMWATRASLVLIFFEMIPLGSTAALVLRPQFITTEVQKQAGAVILNWISWWWCLSELSFVSTDTQGRSFPIAVLSLTLHTRYHIAAAEPFTTRIICSKSVHSDHTDVEVTNSCIRYDALDVIG